jgi:hypothetical protein
MIPPRTADERRATWEPATCPGLPWKEATPGLPFKFAVSDRYENAIDSIGQEKPNYERTSRPAVFRVDPDVAERRREEA